MNWLRILILLGHSINIPATSNGAKKSWTLSPNLTNFSDVQVLFTNCATSNIVKYCSKDSVKFRKGITNIDTR